MRKEQIPLIERADYLHHRNQILTVAGVTLSLFATGTIMGYSSFTIPELMEDEDSPIKLTHDDLSWIASLVSIGCILGALFGGFLSDWIGRKKTIILASILFCAGWIYIARADTLLKILTGRVLTGLASGAYSSSVQVYICEVTSPSIRGVSGSLPTLMVSLGILCIYCVGSLSRWHTAAYVCSFFPLFVLTYTLCLPESPVWLIAKGRQPEALTSLAWLRNDREEAEQECMRLQYLKERVKQKSLRKSCSRFTDMAVLKPLAIGCIMFVFQQFSGIYPIICYATLIFNYANNWLNDSLQTIAIGAVRAFSAFMALFLVKFFPRRVLLIVSGFMMSLSTGVLGGYFYLREVMVGDTGNSTDFSRSVIVELHSQSLEWVPLACLLTYITFFSFGIGVIPWFLISELSPNDTRGVASAIAIGFCQACQFVTVKTFLDMIDIFDTYGTFWFYSGVSFVSIFFVVFCVPETRNLNSGEIEAIFEPNEVLTRTHLSLRNPDEDDDSHSDFT